MPWKSTDAMDQRIKFVIEAKRAQVSFQGLCKIFGIHRSTGYKWLRRHEQVQSLMLLQEQSRRPHSSPSKTPDEIEKRVKELRERYGWGGKKLQVLLAGDGIGISVATVNRILQRNGLINLEDSHSPAIKRFERERPNDLWQMDFKGDYIMDWGRCYPLSILDDHSRYAVGLYALASTEGNQVKGCLVRTFQEFGVPEGILVDHGVPWWHCGNARGLTRLAVDLIKQGVKLYYSGIGHPETQGKVERFHRTLKKSMKHRGLPRQLKDWESALKEFQDEYNYVRPHEGIGMVTPAKRYQKSRHSYQPDPPEWEYPMGAIVMRLNTQGSLYYNGRTYYVCKPLMNERVLIEPFENSLLVTFRHMHIREINLITGRSKGLIKPKGVSTMS